MLCLVLTCGDEVRRLPLPAGDAVLGSSSAADIVAPFPGVSRRHARLSPSDHGHVLADLGSKNGLVVGGTRTERVLLEPGIPVRVGRATLCLMDGSTSDLEVGIATTRDEGSRGESSRGAETAPSGPVQGSLGEALRLLREIDKLRENPEPEDRARTLRSARRTLGSDTLVLLRKDGEGEPGIVELDGTLPDEPSVHALVAAASRSRRHPRPLEIAGRPALVLSAVRGVRTSVLAAVWPAGAAPEAWHAELLAFLGDKLLHQRSPRHDAEPGEPAAEERLTLPAAFVPGESAAMQGLLSQLRATVRSRLDVLLTGETGTGKELIARLIHDSGPSASGPFVPINCAAIPNDLLEAELFGVQARVATGVDPRPGLFVSADGGSIFLDEIGELAQPLQAKLLRVLQAREVLALGATAPRKVDVQVISASNRDLLQAVQQGGFRADLYYRLRGLQFHMPPLRDRREDIPMLATAFVSRAARAYGKHVKGISRKALELLTAYDWPGNVRELESELKRAVLVCPDGGLIGAEHLAGVRWAVETQSGGGTEAAPAREKPPAGGAPPPTLSPPLASCDNAGDQEPPPSAVRALRDQVELVERAAIARALEEARGNRSLAAKILGITRNGLAMKLRRLGGGSVGTPVGYVPADHRTRRTKGG